MLKDALLVENMHDIPYVQPKNIQPETTAMMTRICYEINKLVPKTIPCGVQVNLIVINLVSELIYSYY